MKKYNNSFLRTSVVAFGITFGLLAATGVLAWTGPAAAPPASNASAPLNTSATGQVKVGGLQINTGGAATGLIVSGNVGLGTASPDTPLQLFGASGNLLKLQSSSNLGTAGQNIGIDFVQNTNVETGKIQNITEDATHIGLGFSTYSGGMGEKLRITGAGNVGIGTLTPGYKLDVTGIVHSTGSFTTEGTNGTMFAFEPGSTFLSTGATPIAYYGMTRGGETTNSLSLAGYNGVNFYSGFSTTPAMHVGNGANSYVGIGTVAPSAKLDVQGPLRIGHGAVAGYQFTEASDDSSMSLGYWNTATNNYTPNIFTVAYTGGVTVPGSVTAAAFYYSSDERLKKNIAAIASSTALQKILALQPVTFNWIDPKQSTTTQLGFIAQQVEGIVPELVTANPSTGMKAVDYARVTPLLVGALQAQQKEIDELKAEVAALKAGLPAHAGK